MSGGSDARRALHLGLYALALLLACGAVFGGVLVYDARRDADRAAVVQERYGAVLAAARAQVEALVNIDYRDARASIDAVEGGATGDFAEQYDSRTSDVLETLRKHRSVMEGSVLWAGVEEVDPDSATVIVATTGTVANRSTDNEPVARNFRVKVELRLEDGAWKTSDLEFVG